MFSNSSKKFVNAESIQSAKDEAALDRLKRLKDLQKQFDAPPASSVFAGPAMIKLAAPAPPPPKQQESSDEEDLSNIRIPSSSDEDDEVEWAEKPSSTAAVAAVASAPRPVVEDVDLTALLDGTSSKREKKQTKPNEFRRNMQQIGLLILPNSSVDNLTTVSEPGQHPKELNPYWKEGGSGLPEENPSSSSEKPAPTDSTIPAASKGPSAPSTGPDVRWLKRALLRCQQLSKDEGRSLEEVVAERYGSLEDLEKQIEEAERRLATSTLPRGHDDRNSEPGRRNDSSNRAFMNPTRDSGGDQRGRQSRDYQDRSWNEPDRRGGNRDDREDRDRRDDGGGRDRDRRGDRDSYNRRDDRDRKDDRRGRDDRDDRRDDRRVGRDDRAERGDQRSKPVPAPRGRQPSESSSNDSANGSDDERGQDRRQQDRSREKQRQELPAPRPEPAGNSNRAAAASLRAQLNFPSSSSSSSARRQNKNEDEEVEVEKREAQPKSRAPGDSNKAAAAALRAQLFGGVTSAPQTSTSAGGRKTKDDQDDQEGSSEDDAKAEVVLRTTKAGLTMPFMDASGGAAEAGRGTRRKLETHSSSGDRLRFLPGQDSLSVSDMLAMEKATDARQQNSLYMRFSGKEKLNDDFDVDDAYVDKASKRHTIEKHEAAEKRRAIAEHKHTSKAMNSCILCIERVVKHLIVAFGEKSYLAVPAEVSLVPDHCQIIPRDHVRAATLLEDDAWEEVQLFKKSVFRMFADRGFDVIFMETCMPSRSLGHTLIECFPVEGEAAEMAPIFFKKALLDSEGLWSDNKKVIDIKDNIKRTIPSAFSYFAVEFGIGGQGFAHIIENEQKFPAYFGKEVIGGMIDCEPSLWRRPAKDNVESQLDKACRLQKMYAKYNWTNGSFGGGGGSSGTTAQTGASTSTGQRMETDDDDKDDGDS